ncbi:gp52 domain protein [Burkholderia thailandensis H0587]|nr:gp52 domain protein [Burkholderia thailandensis H0587]
MDTGATPANSYVALYAICNPMTGALALLATNATSAIASSVYGCANMLSGYTASVLVSVWPTNGRGRFIAGVRPRHAAPADIVSISPYCALVTDPLLSTLRERDHRSATRVPCNLSGVSTNR